MEQIIDPKEILLSSLKNVLKMSALGKDAKASIMTMAMHAELAPNIPIPQFHLMFGKTLLETAVNTLPTRELKSELLHEIASELQTASDQLLEQIEAAKSLPAAPDAPEPTGKPT